MCISRCHQLAHEVLSNTTIACTTDMLITVYCCMLLRGCGLQVEGSKKVPLEVTAAVKHTEGGAPGSVVPYAPGPAACIGSPRVAAA